jgi:hypothetical protein
MYVFFEILDQGVINSLDMVLILKYEIKVGGGGSSASEKFFFRYWQKSFAALRFAYKYYAKD